MWSVNAEINYGTDNLMIESLPLDGKVLLLSADQQFQSA
jgi:hypothetical protein